MSEWIELPEEPHLKYADEIGHARQQAAVRHGRVAHNGAPTDYREALKINISGARCEAAGYVYLKPVKWHTVADDISALPDLDDFIDVKYKGKPYHKLIVQEDDPDEWAYLSICSYRHPKYEIVGWCWGHEAKQPEYFADPTGENRAAYFVPADASIMKPPEELRDILRSRQRARETEKLEKSKQIAFQHYCHCGEWGAFGVGVALLKGQEGKWFCKTHKPNPETVSNSL